MRPVVDSRPARRSSGRGLGVFLGGLVLAALAGGAWVGWHTGWLHAALPLVDSRAPAAPAASPSATTAAIVAQSNLIATDAALADATARLSALQQRLVELNQQAAAASDRRPAPKRCWSRSPRAARSNAANRWAISKPRCACGSATASRPRSTKSSPPRKNRSPSAD